jgi:hypothetical protein
MQQQQQQGTTAAAAALQSFKRMQLTVTHA